VQVLHVTPELEREAGALRLSDEPVWRASNAVLVVAVSGVCSVAQGRIRHVARRQLQQVTLSGGPRSKLPSGPEVAQLLALQLMC